MPSARLEVNRPPEKWCGKTINSRLGTSASDPPAPRDELATSQLRRSYRLSHRLAKPSRPWGMKMTIRMKMIPTGMR